MKDKRNIHKSVSKTSQVSDDTSLNLEKDALSCFWKEKHDSVYGELENMQALLDGIRNGEVDSIKSNNNDSSDFYHIIHSSDYKISQNINSLKSTVLHAQKDLLKSELIDSKENEQTNEGTIKILLDSLTASAILIDKNGTVDVANTLAAKLFNTPINKFINTSLYTASAELEKKINYVIQSKKTFGYEKSIKDKHYSIIINPIFDKMAEVHRLAIFISDVTESKRNENELMQLANFDAVTGLHNRAFFISHQQAMIENAQRRGDKLATLFIDLDDFKEVNDTLGHDAGDTLLKVVSTRLKQSIRQNDLVARLGGDEFVIISSNISKTSDAAIIAKKVLQKLTEPYLINDTQLIITASVGIACYPECGLTYNDMNIAADTAMYQAKLSGKNSYKFFTETLQKENEYRTLLINNLRNAIGNNELSVVYQPKVSCATNTFSGVEALLRWKNPALGEIPPCVFIPIAEEIGLIETIGQWVLTTACTDFHELFASLNDLSKSTFTVAVNVSFLQVRHGDFAPIVRDTLKETGCKAKHLQIELTESALMKDFDYTIKTLNSLKKMGVSMAIDDFGMGYSSLSYLNKLPVDTIKIDLSFVQQINCNKESESIIKSILALATALDFETVAEGVETNEQKDFLCKNKCNYLQGYLYGKGVVKSVLLENIKSNEYYN